MIRLPSGRSLSRHLPRGLGVTIKKASPRFCATGFRRTYRHSKETDREPTRASQKLSRLSGLRNGERISKSPSQSEIAIAISNPSPTHRAFSVNVASLAGHLATPATKTNDTGNGIKSARACRDPTTPSATNFFGIHESPDPLDTISCALGRSEAAHRHDCNRG